MKLVKARIRGFEEDTTSRWFELAPKLNLFKFSKPGYGRNFFRILQTINPTFPIQTVNPFSNFPRQIKHDGFTRSVDPAKRTVALAIFGATSDLVKELSKCSDSLYETDRIEVGRRYDNSRWISFVELSSSTRWSEISVDMAALAEKSGEFDKRVAQHFFTLTRNLGYSDRIVDNIKDELTHWLYELPSPVQDNSQDLIDDVMARINRVDAFDAAREIVLARLPIFALMSGTSISEKVHDSEDKVADQDQDSLYYRDLLEWLEKRLRVIERKAAGEERDFLQELNGILQELLPSSLKVRVIESDSEELLLKNEEPLADESDTSLVSLRRIQTKACLAVALSMLVCKTGPILMFEEPGKGFSDSLREEFFDFIVRISDKSQCFYATSEDDSFPDGAVGRRFSGAELGMESDS